MFSGTKRKHQQKQNKRKPGGNPYGAPENRAPKMKQAGRKSPKNSGTPKAAKSPKSPKTPKPSKTPSTASDFEAAERHLFQEHKMQGLVKWQKPWPIGRGLHNLGNTCFLNSVIQCLTHTPALANYLLSRKHSVSCKVKGFCLFCEMENQTRISLTKSAKTAFAPKGIVKNLRTISKRFRLGRQEDAHEFIRFVLDALQSNNLAGFKKVKDNRIKETSFVYRTFGGYLRSQVKCQRCGGESNKYDPVMDLSLEIYRCNSVFKALQAFTAPEVLDGDNKYMCSFCKIKVTARKQLTIFQAPTVLCMQLKRFQFSWGGMGGGKVNRPVEFKEALNLAPFMSDVGGAQASQDARYSLYGVLVHQGSSANSGHYFSYVKSARGRWYQMNDEMVCPASLAEVLGQKAYMLFYTKTAVTVSASPRPLPSPYATHVASPAASPMPHCLPAARLSTLSPHALAALPPGPTTPASASRGRALSAVPATAAPCDTVMTLLRSNSGSVALQPTPAAKAAGASGVSSAAAPSTAAPRTPLLHESARKRKRGAPAPGTQWATHTLSTTPSRKRRKRRFSFAGTFVRKLLSCGVKLRPGSRPTTDMSDPLMPSPTPPTRSDSFSSTLVSSTPSSQAPSQRKKRKHMR